MSDNLDDIKREMQKREMKPKTPAGKRDDLGSMLKKEEIAALAKLAARKEESQEETPATTQEHTVASGDTLSGIAQKHYGSQAKWKAIYEANKEVIGDNPNLIRVGMVLKLPKLD